MNKTAITESDYTRLSTLANAMIRGPRPKGALNLTERLLNSLIFNEELLTGTFVRMDSIAIFSESQTGKSFTYRLVFPADADIAADRIEKIVNEG